LSAGNGACDPEGHEVGAASALAAAGPRRSLRLGVFARERR
jgi:hypothetical protein